MSPNRRTWLGAAVVVAATFAVMVELPAPESDVDFVETNYASQNGWSVQAHDWERSIVRVRNERCNDVIEGTGVIVDGAVLTNAHVIADGSSLTVTTFDGEVIPAMDLSRSRDFDIARIGIARDFRQSGAEIGLEIDPVDIDGLMDSANGSVNNTPVLAGFPAAAQLSVRHVSTIASTAGFPPVDPPLAARLDVQVVPGESGSPLISPAGRVVGLLYGRANADGSGLAISGADLTLALDQLTAVALVLCDS